MSYSSQSRPHYQQIADVRFEDEIARRERELRKAREYEEAAKRSWPVLLACLAALLTLSIIAWGIL